MPQAIVDSLPAFPNYVCVETSDGAAPFRDDSMVGKLATIVPGVPALTLVPAVTRRK
jgi:hypothetical protein